MLEDELRILGLSQNEVSVYTVILNEGKTTPARIAATTGINRTTVYAVAKALVAEGYIQEDDLRGVTYYYPTSPKDLVKVTRKERQALIEKELALQELAKSIATMPKSKKYAVPKIKFVEYEERVAAYLYEHTDKWYGALPENERTWYGFQDHTFVEHEPYRDWITWHWKHSPDSQLYLLSNDARSEREVGTQPSENRHIKFWKKGFDFSDSQWIVGDYSVMLMTREKPHYLVELHDAVYADNMRKLFKNLWEEIK